MKRMNLTNLACCAALTLVSFVGLAQAAVQVPTSAVLATRIFNDCPSSTLTTGNTYPGSIFFDDAVLDCFGFANLHNWRFSADGVNPILFANDDPFMFSADLAITGATDGEAGLLLSPWWSINVDGRFNVRSTDGEIACFGGRLPFYSFTGSQGLHYTKGNTINLQIIYNPNRMSQFSPATIEYKVRYLGTTYTSGRLAFDQGNPAEDPPHGLWGMLTPAGAGGYVQAFLVPGNSSARVRATWSNIKFTTLTAAPGVSTWGVVILALLLLGAGTTWVVRRQAGVA
jgi:hypothetical protein